MSYWRICLVDSSHTFVILQIKKVLKALKYSTGLSGNGLLTAMRDRGVLAEELCEYFTSS